MAKPEWRTAQEEEEYDQSGKYWRGKYLSGSKLEDIFDILRTGEYAAGGLLLRFKEQKAENMLRQARGERLAALTVLKQTANILVAGTGHGIKHRISPSAVLEVEGFWGSLAADIAADPTTYMSFGLTGLARAGRAVIPEAAARLGIGKTVTGIGHVLGEAFVPGYWMKQLPGSYGGYFDEFLDWTLQKRGAAQQAFHELKGMAQPYRKSGEAITKYIESGISTGNKALDKYIDDVIQPHIASMREEELMRGVDVGEIAGYVHHTLTKEGKKFVEQMGGMPEVWKYYAQKVRAPYAKERTLEGTIEEINKAFGFEFFESNFWKSMAVRTQKHVADMYTAGWFQHVQKKYGIDDLGDSAIEFVQSKHPQIQKLLPARISQHLEEIVEEPAQGFIAALGRKHDWGMTWWKRGVTVGFGVLIHPAFFARNVYSGVYQNWLRVGISSPLDYYRGIQARLGKGSFETLERGKVAGPEMQDILREQSILGQPGMMDVILENVWDRNLWQKLRDAPSWLMAETENLVRIPEFVKLAKTMNLKEARDITYETHFAYLPEFHTKFELQYAKRVFPFYTWMSRNIPFQLRRTLEQPGKLGGVGKFQQQMIEHYGMEEEYERRTEWQRNMFLIPNIFKKGKGWIGLGMPFLDLTTDIGDMYFAISPLKLIPELGYIEQDWGSREYKAAKQKRAIKRAIEGRYGTTVRRLRRTDGIIDRVLYLIGMPTYDIAPEETGKLEFLDWEIFKAGEMLLEYPTRVQQMESWERAGKPGKYVQKFYRDELGQLLGVSTFTPEELEELGAFSPSEAQLTWAFRETRKMLPKEQFKLWAKEHVAELRSEMEAEERLRTELVSLRTIRKGEDIPATLRVGGIGEHLDRRRELEDAIATGVDR